MITLKMAFITLYSTYLDEVHEIPELSGVIGWEKIQSLPEDAVIKWPIRRASINNNNTGVEGIRASFLRCNLCG